VLAPRINLRQIPLDRELARLLPEAVARKIQGVCIGKVDEGTLSIATVDPAQPGLAALIESSTPQRFRTHCVAADPESVLLALEFLYSSGNGKVWKSWLEEKGASAPPIQTQAQATVIMDDISQALDRILKETATWKGSHIHFETVLDKVRVRIRQDGLLRTYEEHPRLPTGQALIKRLRSMAPAGRLQVKVNNVTQEFALSSMPVTSGENLVLSLLSKAHQITPLDQIGLGADALTRFRSLLQQPYGIVLACGPNGSGKTTTLYASLGSLQRPERKLVSIEDPIELTLEGVTQVQPRIEQGQFIPHVLRDMLQHDADVIMVGELRDTETALLAVDAARTGSLVLSSLRCNDTSGMLHRLRDLGISPQQLSSTLLGGAVQRLVRRNCTFCQQPVQPTPDQERLLTRQGLTQWNLRKGSGCPSCQRLGHRGRVGLFEVLKVSPILVGLLETGQPVHEIYTAAIREGMQTLLGDALAKAAGGIVPIDEVERVCQT